MIADSMERIGLYEGIIPYAKELEARYRSGDTEGLPFEVRHKQYDTKPDEKRQYEVHFHTIDLMVGLDGAENIDLAPMEMLQSGAPLPGGGDGMKLVGGGRADPVRLEKGRFIAIYPGEAHRVGGQIARTARNADQMGGQTALPGSVFLVTACIFRMRID